jgi:hypothetical protein
MAQKVGEGVGGSEVLQRSLSQKQGQRPRRFWAWRRGMILTYSLHFQNFLQIRMEVRCRVADQN